MRSCFTLIIQQIAQQSCEITLSGANLWAKPDLCSYPTAPRRSRGITKISGVFCPKVKKPNTTFLGEK